MRDIVISISSIKSCLFRHGALICLGVKELVHGEYFECIVNLSVGSQQLNVVFQCSFAKSLSYGTMLLASRMLLVQ